MAIETKYVVIRDGKELGVFASAQEAEAFEVVTERADKLSVVLTACAHEHGLDTDAIQAVARALAGRDKELVAIYTAVAKSKAKGKNGVRAPKAVRKSAPASKAPVAEAMAG